MHFTTLYILKNEELDNVSYYEVEEDFGKRFCYCCGERKAKYLDWCDWFQIGGRWNDTGVLQATRGIVGENGIGEYGKPTYAICEIKDLTEDIDTNYIYSVATKSRIYSDKEEIKKFIDKINKKQIKGVIALIDCHD